MKKILILLLFCCCVSSWAKHYFSDEYIYLGNFLKSSNPDYYGRFYKQKSDGILWRNYTVGVNHPSTYDRTVAHLPVCNKITQGIWDFLSDDAKSVYRSIYSIVDSDSDGFPDLDELDYGSDPNDANSLPAITLIFDKNKIEIGKRFDDDGVITWNGGICPDEFYYTKDDAGILSLAGLINAGGIVKNLDGDNITNLSVSYNHLGSLVGVAYTEGGLRQCDYPTHCGSVYDGNDTYIGSVSSKGNYSGSAGSSSGGHSPSVDDIANSIGGSSVISPEFSDNTSTFNPAPVSLPETPVPDTSTEDFVQAIQSMSQLIDDYGKNLDTRMLGIDNNRSQQANVINNSISALREEQYSGVKAQLDSDLALHNDRTEQLNMIDNSIAGLRDDMAQSQNEIKKSLDNINDNLNAPLEKTDLPKTEKTNTFDFAKHEEIKEKMRSKYSSMYAEFKNKIIAGNAPVIEFDMTPLDCILGEHSLGVITLDFGNEWLVILKNIIRGTLLAFIAFMFNYWAVKRINGFVNSS